jgi:hypothetical protein
VWASQTPAAKHRRGEGRRVSEGLERAIRSEEGVGACARLPPVALNRLHQGNGRRPVVPSGLGARAHALGGNGDQHVDLPTVLFIGQTAKRHIAITTPTRTRIVGDCPVLRIFEDGSD